MEDWRTLITLLPLLPYYVFRHDIGSQEFKRLELASSGNWRSFRPRMPWRLGEIPLIGGTELPGHGRRAHLI